MNPAPYFFGSEALAYWSENFNSDSLFALSNDGQWMGWIGLNPVLDPIGNLGISEILFGYDPTKADKNCMMLAINFLLIKARSLGFWSCLIHVKKDSELLPFLVDSGFKILDQKYSGGNASTKIELQILEKRLH